MSAPTPPTLDQAAPAGAVDPVASLLAALARGQAVVVDRLLAAGTRVPGDAMFQGVRWFRSVCGKCPAAVVALAWDRASLLGLDDVMLGDGFSGAIQYGNLDVLDFFRDKPLPLWIQQSGVWCSSAYLGRLSVENPERRVATARRLLDMGHWQTPTEKVEASARLMSSNWSDWQPLLQMFIEHGLDLRGVDRQLSPMHKACGAGRLDVVQTLVALGASVNAADKEGNTPLVWACLGREPLPMLAYLLDHGADVGAISGVSDHGKGILHHAAAGAPPEALALLLRHGAVLEDRDRNGDTPLHHAARKQKKGGMDRVVFLIQAGANVHARNHAGLMPGQIAPGEAPLPEDVGSFLDAARAAASLEQDTAAPGAVARARRI